MLAQSLQLVADVEADRSRQTPLSSFAPTAPDAEDTAMTQRQMRIMRRVESGAGPSLESGNNTTASSVAPSGPTSDAGDDSQKASGMVSPTESTVAKEKDLKSLETRKAEYEKARERIFSGFR